MAIVADAFLGEQVVSLFERSPAGGTVNRFAELEETKCLYAGYNGRPRCRNIRGSG